MLRKYHRECLGCLWLQRLLVWCLDVSFLFILYLPYFLFVYVVRLVSGCGLSSLATLKIATWYEPTADVCPGHQQSATAGRQGSGSNHFAEGRLLGGSCAAHWSLSEHFAISGGLVQPASCPLSPLRHGVFAHAASTLLTSEQVLLCQCYACATTPDYVCQQWKLNHALPDLYFDVSAVCMILCIYNFSCIIMNIHV